MLPKTVCKKVCGCISSPEFSLKVKESKKATLTFTNVRKFSLYQVYNEFNKKLNCDRRVIVLKPEKYNLALKKFYKRTCYLEFEQTLGIGKHCQIAFNLCSSQYIEKTNTITFEVLVDKFYIDGVVKPIQDINGIYCMCNLDVYGSKIPTYQYCFTTPLQKIKCKNEFYLAGKYKYYITTTSNSKYPFIGPP